jgi:hypothetical protein
VTRWPTEEKADKEHRDPPIVLIGIWIETNNNEGRHNKTNNSVAVAKKRINKNRAAAKEIASPKNLGAITS